jgi:hypothetical protein
MGAATLGLSWLRTCTGPRNPSVALSSLLESIRSQENKQCPLPDSW